jgi:hypothetical protein
MGGSGVRTGHRIIVGASRGHRMAALHINYVAASGLWQTGFATHEARGG